LHVICKKCSSKIRVAGQPAGTTTLGGVHAQGVRVTGGAIEFGPGGKVSFGPGGAVGFGPPAASEFACPYCGHTAKYEASEIRSD
jgi:hypothetical protein